MIHYICNRMSNYDKYKVMDEIDSYNYLHKCTSIQYSMEYIYCLVYCRSRNKHAQRI